tara:strand:- start:1022 stop:2665 length:1644 start_codon:yes stop_codon:yes gene_type:complete
MKIIGLSSFSHDATVTLIEDGKIRACYSDQRFTRDKYNLAPIPSLTLKTLMEDYNLSPIMGNLSFALGNPVYTNDPLIKEIVNMRGEASVYNHHECHAATAYYTSGFAEKTLVFTLDSTSSTNWVKDKMTKDDLDTFDKQTFKSVYGAIFSGENNKLTKLEEFKGAPTNLFHHYGNSINCLVTMWQKITMNGYGFKFGDEGKIMGLAPQGKLNQDLYNRLIQYIKWDSIIASAFNHELQILKSEGWFEGDKMKDFAYTWQKVTEDTTLKLLQEIIIKYPGHTKIALAGGFFANVKVNQKINEYLPFNELYVAPCMGDNGIGLGAAILKSVELGEFQNSRWDDVFLGKGFTNTEVYEAIDLDIFQIKPLDPKYIAERLIEGKLVGLFRGRSEYGPRALGNRTILCDPRKKENHEYINKKLKRNEIMPFAPIIMSEYISEICYAYKSLRAAEFMTLCFTVKEQWISKIPAVIQNDDATCRAQVISKDRNKFCWEVLEQFHILTGVPVLLNTSFNSHGEPIINDPSHALNHFKNDIVDVLVLNNMIIEKK